MEEEKEEVNMEEFVPVIDLNVDLNGNEQEMLNRMTTALKNSGFFYLKNANVSSNELFKSAEWFFSKPIEEKQKFSGDYIQEKSGYINDKAKVDKENEEAFQDSRDVFVFYWNAFNSNSKLSKEEDKDKDENSNLHLANCEKFHSACDKFYGECDELAKKLMSFYSKSLNVDKDFFVEKHNKKRHVCLINHYEASSSPESRRLDAHSDKGTFTFIFQPTAEGFQIWHREIQKWVPVPYLEDAILVNNADTMERWSNSKYYSCPHRVVSAENSPAKERTSIAFSVEADEDAMIEPIVAENEVKQFETEMFGNISKIHYRG